MTAHDNDNEGGPRRILGRASVVAAGTAYQQGITFVVGMLIARVIGAGDYGIFNLARRLLDVTKILTRMGLEVGLQRHFGEARAGDGLHNARARVVLRRVRFVASSVAMLPVLAVAFGGGQLLQDHVYDYAGFADVLLVLALALPFVTDLSVLGGAYRGTLNLTPSVVTESVLLPTIRLLAIIVLFLLGWRLWAVVTGTTVSAFIASGLLMLRARKDFATEQRSSRFPWSDATHVIAYSSVLSVGVLVATLTSSMDVLVLGRFASAGSLGQFSLVKTLLLLMGVFGIAFGQGLGPLVAERYRRNDIDGLVEVMSLTLRWITLGTLPAFAVFLFWGSQLTALFGESFLIAQPVVAWLAIGQYIFSVLGPTGWALSMTGRQGLELKVLSLGLLAAVVLCWYAVPMYGQLGAAMATCASLAIANFTRLLFVRRHIGRFPFGVDVIAITGTGLGIALVCDVAVSLMALPPMWMTVGQIGLFTVAYTVVTWAILLRDPEKNGIRNVAGSTAQYFYRRAGQAGNG